MSPRENIQEIYQLPQQRKLTPGSIRRHPKDIKRKSMIAGYRPRYKEGWQVVAMNRDKKVEILDNGGIKIISHNLKKPKRNLLSRNRGLHSSSHS